ncbi:MULTISPECIES: ribokinase [unclassified Arthrobacter]|uniref:ribokinase n=1 Tax=unclassified Arthrobacter TaxID=235627 RepID=UPI00159DE496|nr:ribokinase [Arthrobacter sp. STN4]MCQ9162583.1 ribokinase [Arthrobacter sp. STN4]NVM98377.1 ribokinase [Arthrobacter sp. SDTb3-6]
MSVPAPGARIVVAGSLNADLTIYCERLPLPGETLHGSGFAVNPGGKSANQAVAAGRLGGAVTLIGAVGRDPNGDMLVASTAGAGVDVSHVRRVDGPTGVAVISVEDSGENSIIISAGANGTLSPDAMAPALFDGAGVVCLCLEVPLETVRAAAQAGHDAGATVLLNLSPYAPVGDALAHLTDVLLVNAHEASAFLGGPAMPAADAPESDWLDAAAHFAGRGLAQVLVTLGSDGSVVLDSTNRAHPVVRIAPTVVDAVDTTGAGDAFTGAVAARLAAGDSLADAARYASVAAALAATRKGTQTAYPNAEEVAAALAA